MADGSRKAIRDVAVGDWVVATDPETGESGARQVLATIVGEGDKELVDVTVATDDGNATLIATDEHPFWVDDEGRWVDAEDLDAGDLLLTPDGELVEVVELRVYEKYERVHNLTVDGIHTYYVTAGTEDILVHNTNCGDVQLQLFDDADYARDPRPYTVEATHQLSPTSYPTASDASHFAESNEALHRQMQADSVFASALEAKYPGIIERVAPGPRGGFFRGPPHADLTWHHKPTVPGLMQLVPRVEHTPAIHLPGNRGGMWVWGGGR